MNKREEREAKAKVKLRELEADVSRLQVRFVQIQSELSLEHKQRFWAIQSMWDETRDKAEELLRSSDESFEDIQVALLQYYSAIGTELKAFDRL